MRNQLTNDIPGDLNRKHGVVAALQRSDGRWLLVKRAATLVRAPGKVGFPGGEVEPGETQREAVVREIQEELGIAVEPICKFWEAAGSVPGFNLHGWLARPLQPFADIKPDPAEVEAVLWLTPREAVEHPDAFAGNAKYLEALARVADRLPE